MSWAKETRKEENMYHECMGVAGGLDSNLGVAIEGNVPLVGGTM